MLLLDFALFWAQTAHGFSLSLPHKEKVVSDIADASHMYVADKSHRKQNAQQHDFFHKAGSNSGITFYDVIQNALPYENLPVEAF